MPVLFTPRLELVPITLPFVEAVMLDRRADVERMAGAVLPRNWPGRTLIERAFSASLDDIRADPDKRLWGDRLMITREGERRLVGSVIFHGRPDATNDGVTDVGYGVEDSMQGQGYATEGTRAQVDWALSQPGVKKICATTPPWHTASIRVLEKSGFHRVGLEEHPFLGEILCFARER